MKGVYLCLLVMLAANIGCKQHYDPKVKSLEQSFLVVEANLNPGPDSAVIRLTRTSKLSDPPGRIKVESNAQVTVEGRDNSSRNMNDIGNGKYYATNLGLTPGSDYRLRIRTTDGKEFLSDYVTVKIAPPIDSIGWDRNSDGIVMYVNTHDDSKKTRYYRWEYNETWQINSYFYSSIIYENGHIRPRILPAEDVSRCWKYDSSTRILLGNSVRLQDDIIYKAPLLFIYSGSDKLSVRYSILLRQYALDKEAYNFFELMKKNTEDIGSLFTPQPSEVRGNVRCITDPGEYVLGYVTASSIRTKRVFFEYIPWDFRQSCTATEYSNTGMTLAQHYATGELLAIDTSIVPPVIRGSIPQCVDCRIRGGSTQKPSYW